MKTTLTLDNDVADYLKEQCRLQDKPFERVVNETLRRGMKTSAPSKSDGGEDANPSPFKAVPFSSKFKSGIDEMKLNQINADLEMEELISKVRKNDSPGH